MDESKFRVDNEPPVDSPNQAIGQKTSGKKTKWLILVSVFLVIIIVGSLYSIFHKAPKPKAKITNQSIVTTTPVTNATTSQYVSNGSDLNLTFNYPNTWSVTPPSNDNPNDQTITLSSPIVSIVDADGKAVSSKIIIQVRPGTATISELDNNSPIIAISSEQIAYTKPTANQTSYPYLTYIHFANASKVSGAFEEVIITGGQSLQQEQSISSEDFSGLDPIISASFFQCATQACQASNQSPLSITASSWQNDLIFQQVLTALESFQLN